MNKQRYGEVLLGVFLVLLDQGLKYGILHYLGLNGSVEIIPGFFYLTAIYNSGAAFGMLPSHQTLFILVGGAVLLLGGWYYHQEARPSGRFLLVSFLAGTVGNLLDRVLHGKVIDYLDFRFGSWQYPIFNFADVCLVVSTVIICLFMITGVDEKRKI